MTGVIPGRKKAKGTVGEATEQAEKTTSQATEPEESQDQERHDGNGGGDGTVLSELKSAMRDAAIEVLKPVARNATKTAAKAAVTKGPGLVKDKVGPKVVGKVAEAGGAGAMAKAVATKGGSLKEKLPFMGGDDEDEEAGGGKGRAATGTGRGRRLPVQEYIDVAVPIDVAYDQYTQFEDFPQFMHRVEKVEQRDDTTLMWHENIWGIRRSWEAEITDQTPCERIAWRSKGGPETVGVITFHRLSDRLTRIYVTMDFQPKGFLEKSASGTRVTRRALKSDLMRFKAYVEMRDDATGAWRGRIEDGEVVESPEDHERAMEDADGGEDTEARSDEDFDEEETEARSDEDFDEEEEETQARSDEDFDEDETEARSDEDFDEEEEPEARSDEEYEDEEAPETEARSDEDYEDEEEPEARGREDDYEEDEPEARGREDDSEDEEPEARADDRYEDEDEDDEEEPSARSREDEEGFEDEPAASPRHRVRGRFARRDGEEDSESGSEPAAKEESDQPAAEEEQPRPAKRRTRPAPTGNRQSRSSRVR